LIFDFESKTAFGLKSKAPHKKRTEFGSKINLKPIDDISFDLRNEFNANQMKFKDLGNLDYPWTKIQLEFWLDELPNPQIQGREVLADNASLVLRVVFS
jgi:hypothetical protein